MGSLPYKLSTELAQHLSLERAVETGTYQGGSARILATLFPSAISIELSERLHREAVEALGDVDNLHLVQGDSAVEVARLSDPSTPTLYWLDAHWSAGETV